MGSESLTAAILGLNDSGQRLLQAAAATGCFQIKAVADLDPQKAEKAAAEHHCDAYSDYRQLIVQNQIDCLLVAAETHTCDEQLKGALRKKVNVLKLAPPARTFAETLDYVRMAESEGVQFAVANPARFQGSFMAAGGDDRAGPARASIPHLGFVQFQRRRPKRLAGRSDPRRRRRAAARLLPADRPASGEFPPAGAGLCPQDQPGPRQAAAALPDGGHRPRVPAVHRCPDGQHRRHPAQRHRAAPGLDRDPRQRGSPDRHAEPGRAQDAGRPKRPEMAVR